MVTTVDARTATLDALRHWAAQSRATLVAAAWRAGNRNITELATAAGCGRDAIYADLRAHAIDPRTDREEPAVPTTTTDPDVLPIPGWRHPNLIEVRITSRNPAYGPNYQVITTPFRPDDPEPKLPAEWDGVHPTEGNPATTNPNVRARYRQRLTELGLVRKAWARDRFTHQVAAALRRPDGTYPETTCAEVWAAYATARTALTAAYAAMDTTPDNMWRSALLRIVDAKTAALDAAQRWDTAAAALAELDNWLLGQLGERDHPTHALRDAAATHGVDTTTWLIGGSYDYGRDSPGWGHSPPAVEEI